MRNRFESVQVPAAVAVGGAIGSLLRWSLASAVTSEDFPWATLITNLLGSLLLGVVLAVGELVGTTWHRHHRKPWARLWRPFLATGVLGGFTTFSTFVLEADRLGGTRALAYVGVSMFGGLGVYALGNAWARRQFGVRA